MRAGPNFLWRSGDRLSGGLTAETGPSSRAPSSADFSSTYRTEGPAGFLMANLLSESQGGRMSQKRIQQIERRIDRIKRALPGDRPDAPGLADPPVQGSPAPSRGLLADQLYPPDEEPHGVRPQGMREGYSPPDGESQAVQTSG